jgi:hypothetical protein
VVEEMDRASYRVSEPYHVDHSYNYEKDAFISIISPKQDNREPLVLRKILNDRL